MNKKINHTTEQIKLYLFVIFLVELFLFGLALVCGRFLGYRISFLVGAGIGIVVAIVFVTTILGGNLIIMGLEIVIGKTSKTDKKN